MRELTVSEKLMPKAKDMREYQQLKVAKDMERDGTARLRDSLKKKHGTAGAESIMRQRGYNPNILK